MASLGSPERVESEGNHHNSRQNHSLEDDFSAGKGAGQANSKGERDGENGE